jgi:hypothetical protein
MAVHRINAHQSVKHHPHPLCPQAPCLGRLQRQRTEISMSTNAKRFKSFADFYPFYLSEHRNSACRRMHFLGSSLGLLCLLLALVRGQPQYVLYGLLCGYGCAWIGHFGFEKNKPASFKQPFYSFLGDWVMYRDMWMGRVPF